MERIKTAKTLTSGAVLPFPYLLSTNILTIHDLFHSFQDTDSLLTRISLFKNTSQSIQAKYFESLSKLINFLCENCI